MYLVKSLFWHMKTGELQLVGVFSEPDILILHSPDRYILMQGIETHGKLIYAGDILGYEEQAKGVVYFDAGSFKTKTPDGFRYHLEDSDLDIAEVLGDIYRNPELFTLPEQPKRFRHQRARPS